MDKATGLVYMQQRYYDPLIPRFLSVDPITAYSNPVGAFNRYWYANNNPYRFTDPDGRESGIAFKVVNEATHGGPIISPQRSEKDWLGPAIGVSMAVVAAPAIAFGGLEVGMVALANPSTTLSIATVAAEAVAGTSIASSYTGGMANAARALKPNGQLIGVPGSGNSIRMIEGGIDKARDVFSQASRGGEVVQGTTYPGVLVKLGDNALIGLRESSTRGGKPPTIDLQGPGWKGFGAREFKFEEPQK